MIFLSQADLYAMTGLRRPSAIRRWLKAEGIRYIDGADGWPRVLQSAVVDRLGGVSAAEPREPQLRLRHA